MAFLAPPSFLPHFTDWTMIRANITARRLLAYRLFPRSYHASSRLGADALDMVDTFARRHSEFAYIIISCIGDLGSFCWRHRDVDRVSSCKLIPNLRALEIWISIPRNKLWSLAVFLTSSFFSLFPSLVV